MGRPIFEICFNCRCGRKHGTNIYVAFAHAPTLEASAADVYANQPVPPNLQAFLSAQFRCKENSEIRKLPDLDAFFFVFTGESTMIVG